MLLVSSSHPRLCGPFGSGVGAGLSTLLGSLCLRFGTYSSASKSLLIRLGKIMRGYCAVVKEKVLTTKAQRTQRVFCKNLVLFVALWFSVYLELHATIRRHE